MPYPLGMSVDAIRALEALGAEEVRTRLEQGRFGAYRVAAVTAWLKTQPKPRKKAAPKKKAAAK